MANVKLEVEVPKELYELAKGLVNVAKAAKEAMADGWQPQDDLPKMLAAVVAEIPVALVGLEKVSGEMKDNPGASIKAVVLAASDLYDVFKPEPKPAA